MAKLARLPSKAVIDGFKGRLDFYVWCGLPCVREWPRKAQVRGIPEVEAQWEAFSYASRLWSTLSPSVQSAYNSQSSRGGLSGRDLQIRSFLSGLYTYSH